MSQESRNVEMRLARRPGKEVSPDDFAQAETPVAEPKEGQILVKVHWLSMDTYLYERMVSDDIRPMVPLGGRVPGRGVGAVVAGSLPAGTLVSGELGWQEYATLDASAVMRLESDGTPESWHLSMLGAPGLTAWTALHKVMMPAAGKTLLVSGAAGTVGSLVGQLAMEMGLKVIGIAGGPEKCEGLRAKGYAAAIDRKAVADEAWPEALKAAAPEGFDYYFDNAGGRIAEAAIQTINPRGQVIVCGHSSEYTGRSAQIHPAEILYKGLTLHGFRVWDHAAHFPEARRELARLIQQDKLAVHETIHEGLASAPAAMRAMMAGQGLGKHLVRVGAS